MNGEVYVYDYGSDWVSRGQDLRVLTEGYFATATVSDYSMGHYGRTVDISRDGTRIIVGSPQFDTLKRGHLSVYELSGESFVLKGDPLILGGTIYPYFARRVALSNDGNTLITTDEDPINTNLERVVYYQYDGTSWSDHGYNHPQSYSISSNKGTALVKLKADGTQLYTLTSDFRIFTPTTTDVQAEWEQRGSDITIGSIAQPPSDTGPDGGSVGDRTSPGQFSTTLYNVVGYVVDLSHDGNTLAIGLPFLHFSSSTIRGAVAVFTYDSGTESWVQDGGLIVPNYNVRPLCSAYDNQSGENFNINEKA